MRRTGRRQWPFSTSASARPRLHSIPFHSTPDGRRAVRAAARDRPSWSDRLHMLLTLHSKSLHVCAHCTCRSYISQRGVHVRLHGTYVCRDSRAGAPVSPGLGTRAFLCVRNDGTTSRGPKQSKPRTQRDGAHAPVPSTSTPTGFSLAGGLLPMPTSMTMELTASRSSG